ncbi:MAG: Flp pilus assembly complex ATPase component TadA [Spirochaetia bacterium]|nr:Flp pilus assembly complex ATPase component TadA [Spirochaetia bacterium]
MANKPKNMLIGEMLLEEGIITKEQLKDSLEEQKRTGEKIGAILIKMRYISKDILWTFLGYQMGVPFINLEEVSEIRQDVLRMLPESLMRNEKLIPIDKQGKVLTVAMSDPLNFLVVDDIKATSRCEIDTRLAPPEDIKKVIDKYYGFKEEETGEVARASVDDLDDIMANPMGRSKPRQAEQSEVKISNPIFGGQQRKPEPARVSDPRSQQHFAQPQQAYTPPQQQHTPPPQSYTPPAQPQQAYTPPQPQSVPEPESAPTPRMNETSMAQAAMSADTPVNAFLTTLISDSYDANATDIHIEPLSDKCRIRRRIDGALYEVESPPKTMYTGLLNKIKELAQMNVNERNVPQESKLKIRVAGKEINMAVYTFPTLFGEKMVLRIMRSDSTIVPIDSLGMDDPVRNLYRKVTRMPYGLILLAGPTNAGKATTMFSTLSDLNSPNLNIFSVDDTSSNYIVPGLNQTKVNRKSYGQVLRYLAEQDCDIIALGDIPNKETAEAVFDMIAGGHMVIANIRANDPYQAMQAIVNYGIESYVVYANTMAVLSQRLIRKVCDRCRVTYEANPDMLKMLGGIEDGKQVVLHKGNGCQACAGTGYKGRTAVFEMLHITEKIKDMLIAGEPLKKVREENKKSGLNTLKEDALLKVLQGTTTIEEYMKIT